MEKKRLLPILLLLSFAGFEAGARTECVPETSKRYPELSATATGLTRQQYDAVLDKVERAYSAEVRALGGDLNIERDWRNSEPNAYADRPWYAPNEWRVVMMGGMARHPLMTSDAFAMVACHELGHHIGGAPKTRYTSWASSEGQSDYFATLKCMRRVFRNDDNIRYIERAEVTPRLQQQCAREFSNDNDAALCIRSIQAGMELARVFGDLASEYTGFKNEAHFNSVNTSAVRSSSNHHPRLQCRFDTYRAGSFCPVSYSDRVSQSDPAVGTCASAEEYSPLALRPSCWYYSGN